MDGNDGGSNGVDPFNGSGWDQLFGMNVSSSAANMVHYQSDSSLVEMVPKISSFGSGSFSEMVNSYGLGECGGQMRETISRQSNEKAVLDDGAANSSSPGGKRKRKASEFHSSFNSNKNVGGDQPKVSSRESSECSKEEKKAKIEQSKGANTRNKQGGKQTNNSNSGEPPKEDYLHMRAKRGQATNSHSLAERVRRERISERMRLLQELVPGCNKITGKAMMLDEIINYVQSLQQQVEFLSMKLATVNPEVNIDIERLLSKDILISRGGSATTLAMPQGLNIGHSFPGIPQGTFAGIPNLTPPFHHLPQNLWDNELQNLLQMGFDPNSLGPTGR